MFNSQDKEKRDYNILWDQISLFPSIQIKIGIKKKNLPLTKQFTKHRETIYYVNKLYL